MGHGYTRLIISPILSSPPFFQSYFSLLEEYLNTPLSLSLSKITHETQASLNLHSAVSFRLLFFPVFRSYLEGRSLSLFLRKSKGWKYLSKERERFIYRFEAWFESSKGHRERSKARVNEWIAGYSPGGGGREQRRRAEATRRRRPPLINIDYF